MKRQLMKTEVLILNAPTLSLSVPALVLGASSIVDVVGVSPQRFGFYVSLLCLLSGLTLSIASFIVNWKRGERTFKAIVAPANETTMRTAALIIGTVGIVSMVPIPPVLVLWGVLTPYFILVGLPLSTASFIVNRKRGERTGMSLAALWLNTIAFIACSALLLISGTF